LSKLAEAQLREQETSARLAETQAAMQAQKLAAKKEDEERAAAALAKKEAAARAAREAEEAALEAKRRETAARAEKERVAAAERERNQQKRQNAEPGKPSPARNNASGSRPANEVNLADLADKIATSKRTPADTHPKRQKEGVSWREILSATDDAAPLNLSNDTAGDDPEANAVRIIERLQNFTLNLERRLYGEPPAALLGRFDNGDRNVFANRILRLNEADVKRRIRIETGRDRVFERGLHEFLQGFEGLLEEATTSESADEELEEYLSSPLGRVYLLIGATVGYFA
jgi:flagellar biosynthesis GTPase FlhF